MSKAQVVNTNDVFAFIKKFITEQEKSPTLREIQRGVGIKSVATVAYHLDKLVQSGLIQKGVKAYRSITLK